MPVIWVSFRIEHEGNYQERYNDLVDLLKGVGPKYWDETTSFFVIETDTPLSDITRHAAQVIDINCDMVLARVMDRKEALLLGNPSDDDIFEIMPYLKYA